MVNLCPRLCRLLCSSAALASTATAFIESNDLRQEALRRLNLDVSITPSVSLHAGEDTNLLDPEELSLGKPVSFESPLFKGKILIRLRNAVSSDIDPVSHARYFRPDRDKRLMQLVLQGKFKRNTKMSDIFVGSILNQPLAKMPPNFVTTVMEKALRKFQPGCIVDLRGQHPKVVAIYAGSAQSMSIEKPQEDLPNMLASDIEENVSGHLPFGGCSDKRMWHLSKPEHASNFEFDTKHVYTLHTYNEFLDFGSGVVHVPMFGQHDLKPILGAQSFRFSAVSSEGEIVYSFEVRN